MRKLPSWYYYEGEPFTLYNGSKLNVHPAWACSIKPCAIHAPSDHPLKNAPIDYRYFNGSRGLMRMCSHSVWHPDTDSLTFVLRVKGPEAAAKFDEHQCCVHKCCAIPHYQHYQVVPAVEKYVKIPSLYAGHRVNPITRVKAPVDSWFVAGDFRPWWKGLNTGIDPTGKNLRRCVEELVVQKRQLYGDLQERYVPKPWQKCTRVDGCGEPEACKMASQCLRIRPLMPGHELTCACNGRNQGASCNCLGKWGPCPAP